jgi:ABC-2 type transport system permease protein
LATEAAPIRQASVWTVTSPKWRSALARLRTEKSGAGTRALLLLLIGFGFWSAVFGISYRVLGYFRGVEEIGALLAGKMLGMSLLAFFSILLLSNLVTALSTFFLAKDLDMLVSSPLDWLRLYLAKLGETTLHSSWMVGLMIVPILTAYGLVFDGGWLFPLVALAALLPFLLLPAVIGTALTLVLVNIFPARRARDVLSLVALFAVGGVVLWLRMARPEQLARPEGFQNLVEFIVLLQAPTHPLLPSEWASSMLMNWLLRVRDPLPPFLLWSTAAALVTAGAALHHALYAIGFTKAQEGNDQSPARRRWQGALGRLVTWLPATRREFILKDLRLFFRDTTQWSQLILLAVLLIVYIFNIRALPLFTGEQVPYTLVTMVMFLNQGLAGFVLAAIAARFVFPSVSLEGRQLWLLKSSPLDLGALLWSKYWIGTLPLLVLALVITLITADILQASPFMTAISVLTIFCFTLAVTAMALGFGAIYPQFESENAAQIPTSFGGMVFMMSAVLMLALITVIESGAVADHLRAAQAGEFAGFSLPTVIRLALVVALCAAATVVPLRLARRRMEELEV